MRRILAILLLVMSLGFQPGWSQVTIYSENFGTINVNASQLIAGPPTWDRSGPQATNITLNTSAASSGSFFGGVITGSGGANLADGASTPAAGTAIVTVSGISTTNYQNIQIGYIARKTAAYTGTITLEWSNDGSNWNTISFTDVTNNATWTAINGGNWIYLPAGADNQANLQLRWTFVRSNTSGNYRIDDFTVRGVLMGSNTITTGSVNTPPFCVNTSNSATGTVDFTSTGNYSNSTFTAYLSDASGNFASPTNIGSATVNGNNPSGSINITIPAGTVSGTGYKIRIDSDVPAVTGSESSNFEIINGANNVSGQNASAGNQTATLSWTNPTGCYNEIMIVAKEGSAVSATPSGDGTAYTANLSFGSGTAFDGGYVVYKGTSSPQTVTNLTNGQTYYFTFFTRNGTDWSSGVTASATPALLPTLVEDILPLYIQGLNGTNNDRIPFAYRVTLQNLQPNTTYRYFNQVVTATDGATSNGAGNVIFVNPGNFVRATNPSMATAGNYGEFTTDATGSYTGWFITEPTGNERFTPGNQVYMRIMLNNGAGGTTVQTRLTTTSYVNVINFGSNNSATEGSGFYAESFAAGKNFVFLYDNVSLTGRPLSGTFVENDGTANTTGNNYANFYATNVNGQEGRWGTILPNANPNGIKAIKFYDLTGYDFYYLTDNDGTWGTVATINPTHGSVALQLLKDKADDMHIYPSNNLTIPANATLTINGTLITSASLTVEDGGSVIANTMVGPTTLKRHISGSSVYHLMSSPVTSISIGNVFPVSQHNSIWIRSYDEPSGNWVNKTISDDMQSGQGFSVLTTDANTLATFMGIVPTSDVNLTLSKQGTSGNNNYDGWNLLGNPFSSAIDRDLGNWNLSNVEPAVYVYDNGNYLSWNGAGTLTNGIIPIGQGFFMKAQVNNGTLTIPADARVHNNQAFYKSAPVNTLRVDVSNAANSYTDALVIRYTEGATAAYDVSLDARKLRGLTDAPEIWCPGEVPTSLNSLSSIEQQPEVTMAFKPAAQAMHTLTFSGIESFDYTGPILLTDLVTGSRSDIRSQSTYEFMASPSDPENRFKLTFASVGIDEPQALSGVNAWYKDGAIRLAQLPFTPCQAELYSTDGKLLLSTHVIPSQNHIPAELKPAVYILRLFDGKQVRNIKFIVK